MKKLMLTGLLTFVATCAVSEDTELYLSDAVTAASTSKKVLIIFDNSGSMGATHAVKEGYNPGETYPAVGGFNSLSDKFIYFTKGGVDGASLPVPDSPSESRRFLDAINNCATARHLLATQGFYTGQIREYTQKGNTGTWAEIPDNNGANVEIIDCQDDVNQIPTTFDPVIAPDINLGLDPNTGTTFASQGDKHKGYPVNGTSDKKDPTYFGTLADSKATVDWSGALVTLYTDNYLRWYHNDEIPDNIETRLDTAKKSIASVIEGTPNIEFGLEVFNFNDGDNAGDANGGRIAATIREMTAANKSNLLDVINNQLSADTWTPLCESLFEASRYFAGDSVDFGDDDKNQGADYKANKPPMDPLASTSSVYNTPFGGCSDLVHVILITDGEPTNDHAADSKIKALTSSEQKEDGGELQFDEDGNPIMVTYTFSGAPYTADGSNSYLPALAEWMFTRDINPNIDGIQRVSTTTVGFSSGAADAAELLEETAEKGGGSFYFAESGVDLTNALLADLRKLPITNQTLTSASVAANNFDRTQTLNSVYYAMFTPQNSPRWQGNLKKYKVVNDEQVGSNDIVAIDDKTGQFSKAVKSFWSSSVDGNKVAEGGVAEMLEAKSNRTIYTNTGASNGLETFNKTNIEGFYGGTTEAATALAVHEDNLASYIDWAIGTDVDDEDRDDSTTDKRGDIFADPLHSKPLVVNYGGATASTQDIRIIIGTNAGALHMFKDNGDTVDETWAFMPNEFFDLIAPLRDNASGGKKLYGIDGQITSYVDDANGDGVINSGEDAWIFFGLRRGGTTYYALDISSPDSKPTLMWKIDSNTAGFGELGQSWSKPKIIFSELNVSGGVAKPTLVFGGGYDTNKDSKSAGTDDSVGRAVYMVDAETGVLKWSLAPSGGTTTFAGTDSIPSAIGSLDSNSDGLADRLYFGDTGGNVWRVDMPSENTSDVSVFKLAELGGTTNATDRRFFYEPSIVRAFISETIETTYTDELGNEKKQYEKQELPYDALLISSGDRSNPLGTDTDDMLFMIKDANITTQTFSSSAEPYKPTAVTLDGLYDYTNDPFGGYTPPLTAAEQAELNALSLAVSNKSGWYIDLSQSGEKGTAEALAINGVAYFTSFTPPDLSNAANSCTVPSGAGWLWEVDLALGTKIYKDGDTSDRPRSDDRAIDPTIDFPPGPPTLIVVDDGDSKTEDGKIIVGRQLIDNVAFSLKTMRTYMYTTEDQ